MSRISLVCVFLFLSSQAFCQTAFKLKWDSKNLPFEVKTAMAPLTVKNQVGQMGTFTEKLNLPIERQLPDGVVHLARSETAYVYLFVKNTSKRKIRFSVAPHSTHPGASALGFSFNCLCNGHIYTAEPNSIWYRIMELKNNSSNNEKNVELMHTIYEVKK
ncbi:MAG: hypothetical protein H7328_09585 [Bdellovibrio sp.]|nr:hypothetical protein [Bdellovibrio sp.]